MNQVNLEDNTTNTLGSQLQPCVEAFKGVSSLDENQAKLCTYWCMLTHRLEEMELFPIMTIFGQHGTGKSSIMRVMSQLVHNPNPDPKDFPRPDRWQGLKMNDTYASLRDGLKEDTTTFIEEGDADRLENERLIADRYSRQTAMVRYKQQELIGYSQSGTPIFGATVIHKRRGYKDPATTSRSLFLTTKNEPHKRHQVTTFTEQQKAEFRNLAKSVTPYPLTPNNRTRDLWYPLIGLAIECGDYEWASWALQQVDRQSKSQSSGGDFDPQRGVVLGIIDKCFTEDPSHRLSFHEDKYELPGIQRSVEDNLGQQMKINEIRETLELLGFEVKLRRGVPRVHVTADKLKKVCADLGIEDEALDSIT